MIKPDSLATLFKRCPDSKWVGDICRALGGQDVDLDFGQRQMLNLIAREISEFEDAMKSKRESWAKNKRDSRKRTSADGEVSANVRQTSADGEVSDISPSSPSIKEEDDDDVSRARTRARLGRRPPTIAEVLEFAADVVRHPDGAYPDDWARKWFRFMEESDPPWTDKDGRAIGNWRQKMITAWRIEKERGRGGAAASDTHGDGHRGFALGQVLHQEGYDAKARLGF